MTVAGWEQAKDGGHASDDREPAAMSFVGDVKRSARAER
jgi:hypothetical protein